MSSSCCTLSGCYIDLEPLCKQHNNGLCRVVSEKLLWQNNQTFIPTPELVPSYIRCALNAAQRGKELAFAIIFKNTHEVVGSIKLQHIGNDCAEIGSTFIASAYQKTAVNSEAKLILMQHAFESLHLKEVTFSIHKENTSSQKAIERLGITDKTSLFHNKDMPQWESYDYYSYAIGLNQWSLVKENLENRLFSKLF